jgi:hypothetical protein
VVLLHGWYGVAKQIAQQTTHEAIYLCKQGRVAGRMCRIHRMGSQITGPQSRLTACGWWLAAATGFWLASGCQRPQASNDGNKSPAAAAPTRGTGSPPRERSPRSQPSAEDSSEPRRAASPAPLEGNPSPENVCGHAVAFAGWQRETGEELGRLLFCDPGDNSHDTGRGKHIWNALPAETPIHSGRFRPTLVLEEAGAFTVCGAVVVSPRGPARARAQERPASDAMPDLSQDVCELWSGLCGPTAAANLVYAIGARRGVLTEGLPRGPSAEADAAAANLIAGTDNEVRDGSLAVRMGIATDGKGVTNNGLRTGLASWLAEKDPDSWSVDLVWLDDVARDVGMHAAFFERLEAETRAGGGAVLCLWPGTEFAEIASSLPMSMGPSRGIAGSAAGEGGQSTVQGQRQRADSSTEAKVTQSTDGRSATPEKNGSSDWESASETGERSSVGAGTSASTPAAKPSIFVGKKPSPEAIAAALTKGTLALERGRQALTNGNETAAVRSLQEALTTLRPYAATSPECRHALARALELAETLSQSSPAEQTAIRTPTTFE